MPNLNSRVAAGDEVVDAAVPPVSAIDLPLRFSRLEALVQDIAARLNASHSIGRSRLDDDERAELQRQIARLTEDRDDAETAYEDERNEASRLRDEVESLRATVAERSALASALAERIQVMEATRGWKALTLYRRWHARLLRPRT